MTSFPTQIEFQGFAAFFKTSIKGIPIKLTLI